MQDRSPGMTDLVPFAVLGLVGAAWLAAIAMAKPRVLLYGTFALTPTQYLFLQVSDFHLSPADVLVSASAFALVLRLAALRRSPWVALYYHRYLALMLATYLVGSVLLGVYA